LFCSIKSLLAATIFSLVITSPANANENAKAFGKRADIEDVALSPDGSQIAFLAPGPNTSNVLYVASTAGGAPKQVAKMDGQPEEFNWCEFVSNTRLVCQIYALRNWESKILASTRLISFDTSGKNARLVGKRDSEYSQSQRVGGGRIIDWLETSGEDVLLSWYFIPEAGKTNTRLTQKDRGWGVIKFDTNSGKSRTVEKANKQADVFISDGEGNVRIMGVVASRGATGYSGNKIEWKYRKLGEKKWQSLASYNFGDDIGFYPQKIDVKSNSVFGLDNDGSRDMLIKLSLDGSLTKDLVFGHPRYDVGGIRTLGQGGRPIGVSYTDEASRIEYFDKKLGKLAGALGKALPNLPSIGFVDASADESKLLLRASSDTDPGRYYIFDQNSKQLNELMLVRPDLENKKLAKVKPINFTGRDGHTIPGYLTIPAGSSGKNLPAIVMPHGGPGARDTWGFDWWAQYYAAEGYAVIQPNFRGSTGYGQDWFKDNGFQSWELAINDINDAGKWMVKEGIANPKKIAIVGWSYGGYAALQSAVHEPNLFKAVIAVAPVADLEQLKNEAKLFRSEEQPYELQSLTNL